MSLFDNAISSIQVGLNDSEYEDRLISSVRNLYSGILLLFKYKLLLLGGTDTSAALIKQNVVPVIDSNGRVTWRGVGNKTIDASGIKERFKSLEISVDWSVFDRINKCRNDAEHFYSALSGEEVSDVLADCFIIISSFLSEHLGMDARKELGDEAWQILLAAYEVYDYEIESNAHKIESLIFHHNIIKKIFLDFACTSCSSPLVGPLQTGLNAEDLIYYCAECSSSYDYDDICNMGVLDLYLGRFSGGHDTDIPFSNCRACNEGLLLKEYFVCTSCGCVE